VLAVQPAEPMRVDSERLRNVPEPVLSRAPAFLRA